MDLMVSKDGVTWRVATPEEIEEYQKNAELQRKHIDETIKISMLPEDIKYIKNVIIILESHYNEHENISLKLKELGLRYPCRFNTTISMNESIGYLGDTISELKDLIQKEEKGE